MKAKIREEIVKIPTYKIAEPEKSPLFIEKRAYQGSTGKVYPLPVTEKIYDEKEMKEYKALILENEYLYVMILPELGGRIQKAYDKTNGYDFVYYNQVIKPALVGLAGPWISGGIEFNWPQHHRPSTFMPIDYSISENADGSVTAYVGETDVIYGTKGMASITLYPDKAYIEIKGQLYNPTDYPQTFLWWANPAVAVNDNTFSVFPPDVNAVYDHGKRDVSTFPIATGEYYKYDYSAGVDISRYKNIKVPTSYMAAHSDFDFIGNFDEGRDAGLLHIADHHISPGKKQWTWGCGDFGQMWDKNLTDEDGPYIELMTGVFTDNQPDFTWLKPQEEKTFTQYFMPYKTVGRVSNATKDAVIGIDGNIVKVYTTGVYENAVIKVTSKSVEIYSKTVNLSPQKCFCDSIDGLIDYCIRVYDSCGKCLCEYKEYVTVDYPVPEPATQLDKPENIQSLEELYLAGQHLEQYRHATYSPADYYLEGLKRDKTDIRLNNAYGLLLLRNGQIKESIAYFEQAIEKQTWRNPNPYNGECYYNLGIAYELLGEYEKAYDAFFKSTWSAETQSQGFYHLACIRTRKQEYSKALEFINQSLVRNYHNMKARAWSAEDTYTKDYAQSLKIEKDDFKILCLTDVHIRNHGTFAASLGANFILDGMSEIQLKKLIKNVNPDLIIVGGDTVLTAWNDICTQQFCDFMEKFEIPWAPVFGNHDYEGRADKAKLAEIYESSEHCLFKSGPEGMNGMGNYIVNLTRNDKPVYSLFMIDDGQFRVVDGQITDGGVNENQIAWYKWAVNGIKETNGGAVPNMAFMHIAVPEYLQFEDNFEMGIRGEGTCTAKVNDGFFDVFKANGGTHMFAGHDHNNNFITELDGVTLGYMTKSSYNCYFTFDALGGTVLTLDKDNNVNIEIVEF